MSPDLIARGDPITPGMSSELEALAWLVGGFWVLVGAVFFVLWFARRQQKRSDRSWTRELREKLGHFRRSDD